jgi:hypothetical protein
VFSKFDEVLADGIVVVVAKLPVYASQRLISTVDLYDAAVELDRIDI